VIATGREMLPTRDERRECSSVAMRCDTILATLIVPVILLWSAYAFLLYRVVALARFSFPICQAVSDMKQYVSSFYRSLLSGRYDRGTMYHIKSIIMTKFKIYCVHEMLNFEMLIRSKIYSYF